MSSKATFAAGLRLGNHDRAFLCGVIRKAEGKEVGRFGLLDTGNLTTNSFCLKPGRQFERGKNIRRCKEPVATGGD